MKVTSRTREGKKALHLSSKSPRRCVCSDGWNSKLSSPQTQIRAFVFFQWSERPKPLQPLGWIISKAAEPWVTCWQALEVLGKRGATSLPWLWRGKKDIPQLCCEDRKVVFGSSLFMCIHVHRVWVLHWACVIATECKSRAKEWGMIYCLVHFHLEVFRVFGG